MVSMLAAMTEKFVTSPQAYHSGVVIRSWTETHRLSRLTVYACTDFKSFNNLHRNSPLYS